jgi:hypothetical protein
VKVIVCDAVRLFVNVHVVVDPETIGIVSFARFARSLVPTLCPFLEHEMEPRVQFVGSDWTTA